MGTKEGALRLWDINEIASVSLEACFLLFWLQGANRERKKLSLPAVDSTNPDILEV